MSISVSEALNGSTSITDREMFDNYIFNEQNLDQDGVVREECNGSKFVLEAITDLCSIDEDPRASDRRHVQLYDSGSFYKDVQRPIFALYYEN